MGTERNDGQGGTGRGEMTVLGQDTRIKGEMHFETGARILGEFEGRITSGGQIDIADTAVCTGEIEAERVNLDGRVTGNVVARDKLSLSPHAIVQGDIAAGTLTVAEGATFVGQCRVGPEAANLAEGETRRESGRAAARESEMKFRASAPAARPSVSAESKPAAVETPEFRPPWRAEGAGKTAENGEAKTEAVRTA